MQSKLFNASWTRYYGGFHSIPSYVYIDDILITSATPEEHLNHLRTVFQHLSQYGIFINPNKCTFGVSELEFLSHHVNHNGITPLPDKVQAVRDFSTPNSQHKLKQLIGMVNFYHHFIPYYGEIMQPLNALLNQSLPKSQAFVCNDTALDAF